MDNMSCFGYNSDKDLIKINQVLDAIRGIDYQTNLSISFKNTIRKFDKNELMNDITTYIKFICDEHLNSLEECQVAYRIKSKQSILMKFDKYYPNTEYDKCFNDILGLCIICKNYDFVSKINEQNLKIIDMRNGKRNNDGYRAIHLYYQRDRKHYPIEIQVVTEHDHIFNKWLHTYVYKYKSGEIGIRLRELYDNNMIDDENAFIKYLKEMI